jgi:hypothetical protein
MTPHQCCPARHGWWAASSGRRGRTSVAWFKARKPTTSRSPSITAERPAGVEPASPAWKAGASAARPRAHKAEGGRVELPRLIARPASDGLPSPVGLTFHSEAPVAGLEPAVGQMPRRLNRPIPATNSGTPDHTVRTAGVEPALSCSRSTRNTRLSYVLWWRAVQVAKASE